MVLLTEGWREALEDARKLTEELRDARLQAQKHRRASAAYRARDERPADPVPAMTPIPDLRTPWTVHPSGCACPSCEQRFGRVVGEHVEGCKCAACFTARKAENGGSVVPLTRRLSPRSDNSSAVQPAPVVVLHEVPVEEAPDDWRSHLLECECLRCSAPPSRYATPRGVS
jgi:hypothetical protein